MKNELMKTIADEALRFSGNALIRWKPTADKTTEASADRVLLSRHLYLAEPFRKPKSYPRQRNYFGLYYFSQTGAHIWHESLNEANMMMYLDHVESISEIASQPMQMVFADGGRHVPDLLALHNNHRQVLYDIKPANRISSQALEQFAKTKAVCDTIGWGYEVLPGLPDQVQTNLTWISYFKHPLFRPDTEATSRLLMLIGNGASAFDDAAATLHPDALHLGRSALFNLLWQRTVRADLTRPIDGATPIERIDHAQA